MSRKRTNEIYIQDIIESCILIQDYTKEYTFKTFSNDKKTVDAVIRNLEIIGEAAKNLPKEVREQYPDLHWRGMTGMRDKLIHGYFSVDIEIIWDTISKEIPKILDKFKK